MCGIVGYVGSRQAWPIVLDGLKGLEYRGYDSAGVVTISPLSKLEFHHSIGKVTDLITSSAGANPAGSIGLGHTRWATHGRPTLANAHPHTDCRGQVGVVHNGIVENFLELKNALVDRGHTFTSETDSEIIAHLIEEGLGSGVGFREAFTRMVPQLRGANAVVAIYSGEPGEILGLRQGNAGGLVIGQTLGEAIVASDITALTSFSDEFTFLDDGELVSITADNIQYMDISGNEISKSSSRIPLDAGIQGKAGYRHFMLKEIMEQPQSITSALRGQVDFQNPQVKLENFPMSSADVLRIQRVILTGCGTSLNASLVGRYLIEQLSGLPTEAESASEFRYRDMAVDEKTLVISIGQSGETADTLAAMSLVKSKGGKLLTICNNEGSQATRLADGTLFMRSGLEIGVASTKTFLASLSLLTLLALYLGQTNNYLTESKQRGIIQHLAQLPNILGTMLSDHTPYKKLARVLYRSNHLIFLGRGVNYPVALEGALKLKEISYIHAEGYAAGEMKHGPIALVDHNLVTVAIAPKSGLRDKMLNSIKEIKARDGLVIGIITDGDEEIASQIDYATYIPEIPDILTPFLSVIPLQLLAYYIAVQRGCDVDQPRNLAKSVTVE